MKVRPNHAVAAGAVVLGMLVATPALAGVGRSADPGGQPPPGSSSPKTSDFELGGQPPAGSSAEKSSTFRLGKQPVNRNPQPPSRVEKVRDTDRGKKGARPTKDNGKKNAPVTRG